MRLTKAQMKILRDAEKWEGEGCGIHPIGGAQHAMFRRMERAGLLTFATFGPDADGRDDGREYPIYTLTRNGHSALTGEGK